MANVLVTGGAGFIGSCMVRYLLEHGYHVRCIDNLLSGKLSNLADVADKIDFIEGDIRDNDTITAVMQDMEFVMHFAALTSVPLSVEQPLLATDLNIVGTIKVLDAARRNHIRRVINISSCSVYGDLPSEVKTETEAADPRSTYAITKLTGEYLCRMYSETFDLQTVSLRYFNVFGPRQDPKSQYAAVVPRFIAALLNGEQPVFYGDGYQTRDFIYVENVCSANLLAATSHNVGRGEVINIGSGVSINLHQLLYQIKEYHGNSDIEPLFCPQRPGDVHHSLADISRARETLGYEILVPFQEGLRETVDWFQKNPVE